MGGRSVVGLKIILLLAGLGLSCSVPLWQREQAKAVESESSLASDQKPAIIRIEQSIPEERITERSAIASVEQKAVQQNPIASVEQTTAQRNTDELNITSQEEIRQIQPGQIAVNAWQGSSFPVENFQTYTSAFGYRVAPDGSASQEFHSGLDMAAPEGSYVRNWWTGTVLEVSDDTACGTSVVVESGGWTATYCHMQGYVETDGQGRYMLDRNRGLRIREGQVVLAGAQIGRVGMTGRTTGPHLHWTLKYGGNYVDPAYVLRAMYQTQQAQGAQ